MSFKSAFTLALATVLWLGGCATQAPPVSPGPTAATQEDAGSAGRAAEVPAAQALQAPVVAQAQGDREIERGRASWYGHRFHGRRTASGEIFNMHDLTAAHKTLPFGTRLRVRNVVTGQEVGVRINDRGPHVRGRVIDLSRAAAERIGLVSTGVASIVLLRE